MSRPTRKPPAAPPPAPVKVHTPDGVDPMDALPRPNPRRRLVPETPAERVARLGLAIEQDVPVSDALATAQTLARKYGIEVRVSYSTVAPLARLVLVP
jgi:hypothetical protein